ncbi:DUF3306 domain-containing protein [Litchfieldella xinjiangensis]|uniref:DUF3306 domain-containing protein n=1 Tax=Litchfieldella xinjiangensis TaxID=1166948 RepID=UPI0006948568|nr:DUF3306 domain-containing protein [Halomonas xinjiangensis]
MSRWERWSQRKRGLVESEPQRPEPDTTFAPQEATPSLQADEQATPLATEPPAEGSLDDTLPDPDTLGPGSDFKAFLVSGVSAGLKRRALRRMYAMGNYNVRDGLDDYDQDFSQMRTLAEGAGERIRQWAKDNVTRLDEENASEEQPASVTPGVDEIQTEQTMADASSTPDDQFQDEPAPDTLDTAPHKV